MRNAVRSPLAADGSSPVHVVRGALRSVPHGFGHARPGVGWRLAARRAGASVNDITDPSVVDAITGNAAFNAVPVRVEAA
jgi:hypothetical protein